MKTEQFLVVISSTFPFHQYFLLKQTNSRIYLVHVTEAHCKGISRPEKQNRYYWLARETRRIKSCTRSRRITSKLIPESKSIS